MKYMNLVLVCHRYMLMSSRLYRLSESITIQGSYIYGLTCSGKSPIKNKDNSFLHLKTLTGNPLCASHYPRG
jgi:uncharacterized membrane protein